MSEKKRLEKLGWKTKIKIENKHIEFITEIENLLVQEIEFLGIKFVSGKCKWKCDLQKVYEKILNYKKVI